MKGLLGVSKAIDGFTEVVGRITLWLVPLVVMVGVYNVIARYLGRAIGQNLASNFYIELQWYIFSIIFLLAGAYDVKHNEHVRVDLLYGRYPPRAKAWVNMLGALLMLIPFCLLLIYYSWPAVSNSWKIRELSPDPGGLPRYPLRTMIIVCAVLLIIQGISELIKNLARLTGHLPFESSAHDPKAL